MLAACYGQLLSIRRSAAEIIGLNGLARGDAHAVRSPVAKQCSSNPSLSNVGLRAYDGNEA
jgi:hypothetical protein